MIAKYMDEVDEINQTKESTKFKPVIVPFKCVNCSGYGTVQYGKKICHSCNGRGYILVDQRPEDNK